MNHSLPFHPLPPLIDPFDRHIDYVRISVTDRCDLRCVYCMSENMVFLPKRDLLQLEELAFLAKVFVQRGVKKIRLTGGEPLVRKNILYLIKEMNALKEQGLEEITITTNGTLLHKYAQDLYQNGVRRVNISIDSLNKEKFKEITRWGNLDQVLHGIEEADHAGLKIKLNIVALKNTNEDEIFHFIEWAGKRNYDITFIEVMPMGDIGTEGRLDQYWPLSMVRAKIEQAYTLMDIDYQTSGPARYVHCKETDGKIGFITPLTHNFCEACNRVRITCTGEIYLCLGQEHKLNLREVMRQHPYDTLALSGALDEALLMKPKGHDFVYSRRKSKNISVDRHMSVTGG